MASWCDPFVGLEGSAMGQTRRDCATTAHAIRVAIQQLQGSTAAPRRLAISLQRRLDPGVGLTPLRNQSGEQDVEGGITKAGDVNLTQGSRQAATFMINRGRSTWLRTWVAQLAQRRCRKIAKVAKAFIEGVASRNLMAGVAYPCEPAKSISSYHHTQQLRADRHLMPTCSAPPALGSARGYSRTSTHPTS